MSALLEGKNYVAELPFGEQLGSGVGIRSANLGYGGDSVRQKFGSKERDNETNLDYFLARYYSSVQGRFTSVDPDNAGADPELPQTWNGYSYTINNPLTYSDPDGLKVKICDADGNCSEISDADARKYFYNKEYQNQSGYRIEGPGKGNVYDTADNKIGTYERTSADDMSGFANAVFFGRGGLIDRAPGMKAAIAGTLVRVL
jgi:RHS repeat-associated protein